MEYQKIKNLLDNTNQSSIFKTKSHGVHNVGIQIEFKNSMLRSALCDYSDAYILETEEQQQPLIIETKM